MSTLTGLKVSIATLDAIAETGGEDGIARRSAAGGRGAVGAEQFNRVGERREGDFALGAGPDPQADDVFALAQQGGDFEFGARGRLRADPMTTGVSLIIRPSRRARQARTRRADSTEAASSTTNFERKRNSPAASG
jgi:hypothetical protein